MYKQKLFNLLACFRLIVNKCNPLTVKCHNEIILSYNFTSKRIGHIVDDPNAYDFANHVVRRYRMYSVKIFRFSNQLTLAAAFFLK